LITLGVGIFFPGAAVLVGAFLLGNLLRISGLLDTLGGNLLGPLYRLILFFVVLGVGATMTPAGFLTAATVRTLMFTLIALLLNGLVWVFGAPRAYRWAGVQPRDGQEGLLGSLLAVGVLLGIASFLP
jgi:Na+-transporting methylmalonyl-CoA/oxaloacetate decarboxylase beta subunit